MVPSLPRERRSQSELVRTETDDAAIAARACGAVIFAYETGVN
jgi:hypothetical protein